MSWLVQKPTNPEGEVIVAGVRKPRIVNTSRILRNIWTSRRISRVQLARELGLNKSTITNIVGELIQSGIIIEIAEGSAGPLGGRKPVHIELNKNYGYVLGLEVRPESYTAVAVDLGGDILFSRTEQEVHSADNFRETITELLKKLPGELSWLGIPIIGAGVGISGIVNSQDGRILGSIPLRIVKSFDFKGEIASRFDFPVFVENDANSCAWGELAFHRTQKLKNLIFTLVEFHTNTRKEFYETTSVGFGIVFEGNVYHGNRHSAGEFHSVFCEPEHKGQFRVSSIEGHLEQKPEKLKEFIWELSKHLALFINTFNLGQIFLGGDIERHQDVVMPILLKAIDDNWVYDTPVECEIRFSSLGDKSVAFGAAGMVLERLFMDPDSMELNGYTGVEDAEALPSLLKYGKKTPVGV
jgi:predicted NBD/HSP70 family sugar kinase